MRTLIFLAIFLAATGAVALVALSGPVSAKSCSRTGHHAGRHASHSLAAHCVGGRHLATRHKAQQTNGQAAMHGPDPEDMANPP